MKSKLAEKMIYGQFFHIINCVLYIFIEDDFTVNLTKERVLYGFTRMELSSRECFLIEIKAYSEDLYFQLNSYIEKFDQCFSAISDWNNEVAEDDITSAFETIKNDEDIKSYYENLLDLYEKIDLSEIGHMSYIFMKYGLGVTIPPYFKKSIFDECIFKDSRWEAFRIYTDYDSKSSESFKNDLTKTFTKYSSENVCITCIIDNSLAENRRAKEILNEIENLNKENRKNIIGAVFTSKGNIEKVSDNIFFEYVNKDIPDKLQIALTKSAYSLMIYKLKEESKKRLDISFSKALNNRNIAFYLAKMAAYEGIGNYQVVNDWIKLMYGYEMSQSDQIPHLIKLTRLIDQLEDENISLSEDLIRLNSYEAFDFNVNKFYQPPAAGDIFEDSKGKLYILIGQDCDIMMSGERNRNNAITELVTAEKVSQTEMKKLSNNLDFMMVGNYKANDGEIPGCLKIRYSSRKYINNEIINLCSFNRDGECRIDLESSLSQDAADIMIPYLVIYYSELQKYFKAIDAIKRAVPSELNHILKSDFAPRVVPVQDYEIRDGKIIFRFKRICRLNRPYVLYLHKLFLEHRGRHPFDSINLSRHQTMDMNITNLSGETVSVHIILSPDRETNRNSLQKLEWVLERQEIELLLEKLDCTDADIECEDYIYLKENPCFIKIGNSRQLKLTKQKKCRISAEIM